MKLIMTFLVLLAMTTFGIVGEEGQGEGTTGETEAGMQEETREEVGSKPGEGEEEGDEGSKEE